MKLRKTLVHTAATGASLVAYLYSQNTRFQTTHYRIPIHQLAVENVGIKVAQLSDLHFPYIKINQDKLIQKLVQEQPDLIFLTGDQMDAAEPERWYELHTFLKRVSAIAPSYAIMGNHDHVNPNNEAIYQGTGVTFLDNQAESITLSDRLPLLIMGVSEPSFVAKRKAKNLIKKVYVRPEWQEQTKLLLAHRPELFEKYQADAEKSPDLTFSGHAHGGQVRFKGIGGLFAPGQGRLPKHTAGVFSLASDTHKKLVVSRGLGPSHFPLRVNNRPELVIVTLVRE